MPPPSLRSATLSFGLVTIPVRFYTATSSQSPHFHLIHEQCGSRIKQQLFCPTCGRVVERKELVRGYEVQGHSEHADQYVLFTDEELRALEMAASPALDITEFVPLDKIDPTYFESTYYLGPEKAGEKAYRLLVETMADPGLLRSSSSSGVARRMSPPSAPRTAPSSSTLCSLPTRCGTPRRSGRRRLRCATQSCV